MMRRAGVLIAALASLLAGPATVPASANAGPGAPDPVPALAGALTGETPGEVPGALPAEAFAPVPAEYPARHPAGSSAGQPAHPAAGAPAVPYDYAPRTFTGVGFDTCHTPSFETMQDWTASPYRAVGVYIGGRARACPDQPNLTPGWVRAVDSLGWRLLPLYVGSQAPCVHAKGKRRYTIDGYAPRYQGVREGADAVRQARALGMHEGSPVYLDMEAYDQRNASCARTTLAFVQGWSREVRRHGYLPGFYSSSTSGIQHMERARRAGAGDLPGAVWFARWQEEPDLFGEPVLASDAWQPHRRVHQYRGNIRQTWGGRTLKIDANLVDAPVAVVG
ncbi:DUF1906 domain-containing protein [Streptomyces sp. JJ36]|uniref:DUF1906 domain-containing protein n=1 Tax=Streptomyces sp. JJ36 TaxID=2736645 RepID=UPI001F333694|nr:DUF1906 domain-containing protein [Streptomyces sp. JJ36]MCF6522096.1 DUF1906 domain-containing protein [Streptomyces sp. JJ36]